MNALIYIGLFLPFISFICLIAFNKYLTRNATSLIACGSVFISFLCFFSLFLVYVVDDIETMTVTLFTWLDLKNVHADFMLRLDHLSMLMTLLISGVGFIIHVYSIGYTDHEKDFVRYFALLNLFIFSMLLLVLGGNLLLIFIGWEGVGLVSYLLIGYWYTKEVAARAATKALIVNRIGDLGFLLGILLAFYLFGTTDIEVMENESVQRFPVGDAMITLLCLLLFIGDVGKSAQIPLHVWLPDAMAGPTPVSALIHAATMVTGGVYLIVRMNIVYLQAPFAMHVVGIVGAATALYAALSAIAQTDLKKILAYSTVSQLGFMFLACGAGAFYSAMFHLTMHAFIKGLLFLSAGNVVHMMHGTTELSKMGGLSKKFKITHWLFLIGVFALSGVPPFSAFFSKDLILEQEYLAGFIEMFYIGLTASILTAIYLTRAYFLAFRGPISEENANNPEVKEAPPVMLGPVMILAVLAITGGALGATTGSMPLLEEFLSEVGISPAEEQLSHGFHASKEAFMAIFGPLFAILFTAIYYTRAKQIPATIQFLKQAFFFDQIYDVIFVRPLTKLASFIQGVVEPKVFEGSIDMASKGTYGVAGILERVQNGQIRTYIALMVIGSALLLFYLIF